MKQRYFGPDVKAVLICDQVGCQWRMRVRPGDAGTAACEATVEFTYQPRDDAGLAEGEPTVVCRLLVPLQPDRAGGWLRGHVWLPGRHSPRLWQACHVRVRSGQEAEPSDARRGPAAAG